MRSRTRTRTISACVLSSPPMATNLCQNATWTLCSRPPRRCRRSGPCRTCRWTKKSPAVNHDRFRPLVRVRAERPPRSSRGNARRRYVPCSFFLRPISLLMRDAPGTRPERIAHPAHRNPPRADPDTPDTSLPVTLSSIARRSDDAPRRGTFVTTRRTRRFTTSRVRWRLLARAGARARDPKRRLRRYRFRVRVRLRGCLFFGRRGRFARAARRRSGDRRDERRGTSVEGLGASDRRVVFGARRRGVAGDAVPTKRRRDGRREGCVFFSSREDSPGGGRVSAALSARANRASDAERVVHVASLVRSASTRLRVDA